MRPDETDARDRSILGVLAQPIALLLTLAGIAAFGVFKAPPKLSPPSTKADPVVVAAPAPEANPEPILAPSPRPAPTVDLAAVAKAEEALKAARLDRARAEGRAAGAAERLEKAQIASAGAASAARAFLAKVKNPGDRVARVVARRDALAAEKAKLETEVAAIEGSPKPARKNVIEKNPVARPAEGKEFHFEVRADRITVVDLDRLTEKVKADVRLQTRQLISGKPIGGIVGPVGDFSMRYEVGVEMPDSVEQLLDSRGSFTYQLRGWELVPDRDRRGETFEATRHPASEFARAVRRLSPVKSTITMWVYPDGFALYRRLRDELHAQGFLVAARPLPEGVAIQGSPGGSKSAGQ